MKQAIIVPGEATRKSDSEISNPRCDSPTGCPGKLSWLKETGQPVLKGEAICEILVEKIILEVAAPTCGLLVEKCLHDGDITICGTVLGYIDGEPH